MCVCVLGACASVFQVSTSVGETVRRLRKVLYVKFPSWMKLATSCKRTLRDGPGRGN